MLLFSTTLITYGQNSSLPKDILEFYRSSNFVNAFTTTSEKAELIKAINLGKKPSLENKDDRLKTAYQFMQQSESRILKYDTGQSGSANHYLSNQPTVIPGLYKILNWKIKQTEISVRLEFYYLDDGMTSELISGYKVTDQYTFDNSELFKRIFLVRESTDIHRWVLTKDGWMKEELNGVQ
jgi:hypothetical protein